MLDKIKPYLEWIFVHKTVVLVIASLTVLLIASLYFRTAPLYVSHDPVTPVQPVIPKVDYSVDKNRLQCILNRTPAEVQKLCEEAFPYSK